MVCFQSTPTSVGRSRWIRTCSYQYCSRRATVGLGIDTLIANILVINNLIGVLHCSVKRTQSELCIDDTALLLFIWLMLLFSLFVYGVISVSIV